MDGIQIKKFKKRSITLYSFHVARQMKEQFWKFELYFEVIESSRRNEKNVEYSVGSKYCKLYSGKLFNPLFL